MIDFLFLAAFFLFPITLLILMKVTGFSVLNVRILQFVILSLFMYSYLGILPLYMGWDQYRLDSGVDNKEIILKVYSFSIVTIFLVYLGGLVAKQVISHRKVFVFFSGMRLGTSEFKMLVFSLVFVFFILFIYLNKVDDVALVVAFKEGLSKSQVARSLMSNGFENYHWYKVIMRDFGNIVTFSLFSLFVINKNHRYKVSFLFSFLLSSFIAIMTTEKAPFAYLLIGLFLVYIILIYDSKYPIKHLIALSFMLILILAIFYMFFMGASNIVDSIISVMSRAFAGSIQPAYHYLEYFPSEHEYLYGKSFPNPGMIFPYEPYNLTIEVMNWVYPYHIDSGVIGTMPTVFWGELYANFGFLGIVIFSFFIGVFLYILDYLFSLLADSSLKVGFYVWCLLHYKDLSVTGLFGFIFDFYLIIVTFLFLVILLLSGCLKGRFYNSFN
ncbi:oligosaccharide repeat unit polymerase [Endozoicomonas sp. Mp262]|uniref:O-antigen polymerase n=1 Tax=Endozoicomonas sp. Mp262 TaxID=2919499 RepID=UPI0021D84124